MPETIKVQYKAAEVPVWLVLTNQKPRSCYFLLSLCTSVVLSSSFLSIVRLPLGSEAMNVPTTYCRMGIRSDSDIVSLLFTSLFYFFRL